MPTVETRKPTRSHLIRTAGANSLREDGPMHHRPKVAVVGSINQDITVQVERFPGPGETLIGRSVSYHLGGKGANQAVAAARAGAEVWFVGAVGEDAAGAVLRQQLTGFGVHDDLLLTVRSSTGTAHIMVDATGENSIVVVPGANGLVEIDAATGDPALRGADVLVTQGEVPPRTIAAVAALGKEAGVPVVLNLAPAIEIRADVFEGLAVLVVNETEAALILGSRPPTSVDEAMHVAERLLALGAHRAVVTLGKLGAVHALGSDGGATPSTGHVPSPVPSSVVDTTGAGDAAVGVMATALAAGLPFPDCVAAGVRAGSLAVEHPGAASGYPPFTLR